MKHPTVRWIPILNHFQWFRKWYGGAWTKMSGCLIPHWLWSSPEFVPASYPNTLCKWEVWAMVTCLLLCSCELPSEYLATSGPQGNMVRERRMGQIGGTRSSSRSDGSSEANSYENSLRDTINAVGIAYGLKQVRIGRTSDNARDVSLDAASQETKRQAQAQAAELAKQRATPIITSGDEVVQFPP